MNQADAVIVTTGLSKHYGSVIALDQLSLTVPRGAIYGFLGPNGAGKTTTIKILMGFIRPSAGSARLLGRETWREGVDARASLGFLVQPDNLYPDMSGKAHLRYAERLNGRPAMQRRRLLDALELSDAALGRRLSSYSKGMRQKLALVAAMQHDPELVILDEPTDGLDPLIQRNFESILSNARERGCTVFMSSHDLAEVERTCDRVAVVKSGRLVAEATVEGLKRLQRRRATIRSQNGALQAVAALPGVSVAERTTDEITVMIDGDLNPLLRAVAAMGVDDIVLAPPSLDDIFMGFYDQSSPPQVDK
jgi:ABC-2 type transport system ATP-binding protein